MYASAHDYDLHLLSQSCPTRGVIESANYKAMVQRVKIDIYVYK